MAVINQLNINLGTGANQNFVLHDINDKRITTTAITTCSHILASNSASLTSIAPITAANLASALGGQVTTLTLSTCSNLNDITTVGRYFFDYNSQMPANVPSGISASFYLKVEMPVGQRLVQTITSAILPVTFSRLRASNGAWSDWYRLDNFGANTPSDLASLLGVASGLEIVDIKLWSAVPPSTVPNITYGMCAIFRFLNSSRYLGIAASVVSNTFYIGATDSLDNPITWKQISVVS